MMFGAVMALCIYGNLSDLTFCETFKKIEFQRIESCEMAIHALKEEFGSEGWDATCFKHELSKPIPKKGK